MNNIGTSDTIAAENEVWSSASQNLINCTYKTLSSIKASKGDEVSVLSLNIRSIASNLKTISDDIENYQKFDVICLNETNCVISKLPNGIDDILLDGFHSPIVQDPARPSGKGGGLVIYVHERVCSHDDIHPLILDINSSVDGEFQFVRIENFKKTNRTVIVTNVYRSPSRSPNTFLETYLQALRKLNRHKNKLLVLTGDHNIDLIKYDHDSHGQELVEITASHGFLQVISRPTRVTDHSATLIDHIYINSTNSVVSSNVITLDITDHLGTNVIISLNKNFDRTVRPANRMADSNTCNYRVFNSANDENFKNLIQGETWEMGDNLDAEEKYDKFCDIYTKHYESAYPSKNNSARRRHERAQPKPWILPWLEDAIHRKQLLYHDFIKHNTTANKVKYDKMKKFTEKHVNLSKRRYYAKFFEEHKDNSKKQWGLINELLNRGKKTSDIKKVVGENGESVTDNIGIAEQFNSYFSNIASNLKSGIRGDASNNYGSFMDRSNANTIYLSPAGPDEIATIIRKLKNKSTLDTKVSAIKIASNCSEKFNITLSNIVSASLAEGIFPSKLKCARVVPIHKGGSKTDVTCYRPISLLSSFSKIYEKVMHCRIVKFMEENDTLYKNQFGFRAGRSCEHALLAANSKLLDTISKNQVALLLMIDFSKAFDLVEHTILLEKLYHYGIRGPAHDWLRSYLSRRSQFVSVNGTDSNATEIRYGVPQGSILGPLLFVIYTNDLPNIDKAAKFILYADDANIIVTGNDMCEIKGKVESLATQLLSWVNANGLLLNLKKTNYMVFSKKNVNKEINLAIKGSPIKHVSEAKFLGVIIDEGLTWSAHIVALRAKMSRYTGIMFRIKHLLPLKARMLIFNSFVQSHINYCSLVWGFSAKSNIDSLFTKQKNGIRAIMPGHVRYFFNPENKTLPSSTKTAYCNLGLLTIHNMIAKNAAIFMFKLYNFKSLLPDSIAELFPRNIPLPSDMNHEKDSAWLNTYGTTVYRNSLFYKGPLLLNSVFKLDSIPPSSYHSINIFKKHATDVLLSAQSAGSLDSWEAGNNALQNIKGLRCSSRNRENHINYMEPDFDD